MAVLPLVQAPDPRLKEVSRPVAGIDTELRGFMKDMLDTMYAANGIGLAAIQVGVPKRVVVIDLDPKGPNSKPIYLVNPEIVWRSDEAATSQEGCLSVPEFWEELARSARIRVCYTDENNKTCEVEADGLLATCLQHEIDHTNGLLFIDHLSKLKRNMALRKSAKVKRQSREG